MCYLLNRTQTKVPNLLLTTVNIRFSFYIFRKKGAARLTYYVLLQFNQKEKGTCWGISYNAKGRGHDPFNPTPLMLENKKKKRHHRFYLMWQEYLGCNMSFLRSARFQFNIMRILIDSLFQKYPKERLFVLVIC